MASEKKLAITAQNTWTDTIEVAYGNGVALDASASTGVGTVVLQRSLDGTNWIDIMSKSINNSADGGDYLPLTVMSVRAGIKTGGFTSGTINVVLRTRWS